MIASKAQMRVVLAVRHKDNKALLDYIATIERGEINRTLIRLLNTAIGESAPVGGAGDNARFQALLDRIERLESALLRADVAISTPPMPAAPAQTALAIQVTQPKPVAQEAVTSAAHKTPAHADAIAQVRGAPSIDPAGGDADSPSPEITAEQAATMRRMLSAFNADPDGVDSL